MAAERPKGEMLRSKGYNSYIGVKIMAIIFYIKTQATIHLSWIWVSPMQVSLWEAGVWVPITAHGEPGRAGHGLESTGSSLKHPHRGDWITVSSAHHADCKSLDIFPVLVVNHPHPPNLTWNVFYSLHLTMSSKKPTLFETFLSETAEINSRQILMHYRRIEGWGLPASMGNTAFGGFSEDKR